MSGFLENMVVNAVMGWFVSVVAGALDTAWGLVSYVLLQSPDVTHLKQVQTFAGTSRAVVDSAYVLAFLAMGIMVMGRGTIQTRYGPGELIPRLVIGLILSNLALPLCSTMIGLSNALTSALTEGGITSPDSLAYLQKTTEGSFDPATAGNNPKAFMLVFLVLLVAVLLIVMMMQTLIRIGLLIVLVGVSPLALALHATPQTEPAAKLWWRSIAGTLGTVTIQAVVLHTALQIFLDPTTNYPALGLAQDPGATVNLLFVIVLLLAVVKVPGLMRRYVTKSSPGQSGQILRVVVLQQLTGLLRTVGRAGSTSRARTAAAGRAGRAAGMTPARPAANSWPTRP